MIFRTTPLMARSSPRAAATDRSTEARAGRRVLRRRTGVRARPRRNKNTRRILTGRRGAAIEAGSAAQRGIRGRRTAVPATGHRVTRKLWRESSRMMMIRARNHQLTKVLHTVAGKVFMTGCIPLSYGHDKLDIAYH